MSDQLEALARKPKVEEAIPVWIKIFGGSIVSVLFLCVITVVGYVVNNLNSLQIQINTLTSQMITKDESSSQHKVMWDTFMGQIKATQDTLAPVKERVNTSEQLAKERQVAVEKIEARQILQEKSIETVNLQLREEIKSLQKDLLVLRERLASIEGKIAEKK